VVSLSAYSLCACLHKFAQCPLLVVVVRLSGSHFQQECQGDSSNRMLLSENNLGSSSSRSSSSSKGCAKAEKLSQVVVKQLFCFVVQSNSTESIK
jgi:hypothetical protein